MLEGNWIEDEIEKEECPNKRKGEGRKEKILRERILTEIGRNEGRLEGMKTKNKK